MGSISDFGQQIVTSCFHLFTKFVKHFGGVLVQFTGLNFKKKLISLVQWITKKKYIQLPEFLTQTRPNFVWPNLTVLRDHFFDCQPVLLYVHATLWCWLRIEGRKTAKKKCQILFRYTKDWQEKLTWNKQTATTKIRASLAAIVVLLCGWKSKTLLSTEIRNFDF